MSYHKPATNAPRNDVVWVTPLALGVLLAGCATTQSAVKKTASFSKYRKVYLLTYEEDPRKVLPKVKERLEKLGFEVVPAEEDSFIRGRQGTGFIITRDGYLLTAAHVLGKKTEATVWLNGKRYVATLIYRELRRSEEREKATQGRASTQVAETMEASLNSEENRSIAEELGDKDMALLKITSPDRTFLPASFASAPQYRMGQDVYTIGFPLSHLLGDKPRLNKGLLSSTVGMKDHPQFVQISAEVQPGNSGGPLLNEKGQVIGMVQATLNPMKVLSDTGDTLPQNVNFAAKNGLIKEFLETSKSKTRLSLREDEIASFDEVQHSIVQVHAGIVPEGFKQESKLACAVSYSYVWDLWYRFQLLDVVFHDLDTQEVLLRAGQYGDNPLSTENQTIEDTFKEIKLKMGR